MRILIAVITLVTVTGSLRAIEISREKCDELIAKLPAEDPWEATRDASALAWGEAGTTDAFVNMYEATADRRYLTEVVRRGDRMISHRDDRRGVVDCSGKSRKAWSMASKYTVAEGYLLDAAGRRVIRLRSTLFAYNNQTQIELKPSEKGFMIHATNEFWKRDETFTDLSLDQRSPRFFQTIINNPHPRPNCAAGSCTELSQLVKADFADKADGAPTAQKLTLQPIPLAYGGYIGIIYHPLLRFAEIVNKERSLSEFREAATRFVTAADESYAEIESHFRNGPGRDEGYYIFCERGESFPYDNLPEPFNYLGKHVSSELALHRLTGKAVYMDHVQRMTLLFRHRLKLMPGNLYVWYYWYEPVTTTGWKRADDLSDNMPECDAKPIIEDVSHATLDIQMVVNAADAGVVLDESDVRRFANTFLNNVVMRDRSGINGRVDGSEPNSRYVHTSLAGWLPLAAADPRVYDACRELYVKAGQEQFYQLAALLKWKERVAMTPAARDRVPDAP